MSDCLNYNHTLLLTGQNVMFDYTRWRVQKYRPEIYMHIRKASKEDCRAIAELGLMAIVDRLALEAGCRKSSIEVFEENTGALRFYERLGYRIAESRPVVRHSCHPYKGQLMLLTRDVSG